MAVIARFLPAWTEVTAIPMAKILSSGDWRLGTAKTDSLVDDPRLRYCKETDRISQDRQSGENVQEASDTSNSPNGKLMAQSKIPCLASNRLAKMTIAPMQRKAR